jgi:hypothetical protein
VRKAESRTQKAEARSQKKIKGFNAETQERLRRREKNRIQKAEG